VCGNASKDLRVRNAEEGEPVGCGVGEVVGRDVGEGMGFEAEGAADAAGTGVAGGEDVDVGVADHDGFGGGDGLACDGAGFGDEDEDAVRVGLFGVEAVAAVVLEEEGREGEVVADVAGGVDGLVGEDGHEGLGAMSTDSFEGFEHARVDVGVVELVDAVVVEEKGDGFGYIFFVVNVAFGVAQSAADKQGNAIADVAGDDRFRQFGLAEVGESGVDGVAEIDAGVDEGAVQVEDDEAR
jgi:hypothetical protein